MVIAQNLNDLHWIERDQNIRKNRFIIKDVMYRIPIQKRLTEWFSNNNKNDKNLQKL